MLQLLNPVWLWAIAGIIVPVAIHLWHVKTGKTLKIGSIALLGESAKQSSRSFKITDLLLLLLRCLMLIVLALLLTAPFWQKQAKPIKAKGWVLLEKQPVKEVYARFKPEVDSLLKAGFELHELDTSFKAIKSEEILKDTKRSQPRPYWALLKLLEQQLPPKTPVYLFTTNQQRYFKGKRPELNLDLHWKTYTPADSVSSWIQNAYLRPNDQISMIIGNSQPSGTSFSTVNLSANDRSNSVYNVSFDAGKPFVSLKNNSQKPVAVDTSTLKITIYQNQFPADAAYLEAALQSVKKFSGRKIKIISTSNFNQVPVNQNWIFWLSNQNFPLNNKKLISGGNVFKYATGRPQTTNSWISTQTDFAGIEAEPIHLYQRFLADKRSIADQKRQLIWQDGFGQPVLSSQPSGNTTVYNFYSHFNPSWNDLPWNSDFPKIILNLVLKSYPQQDFLGNDRRTISSGQLQTSAVTQTNSTYKNSTPQAVTDLKHACWIALFLLFLLERIVSAQTKKEEIYA